MIPAGDGPRYEWRGVMLDVARHFFPLEDVKRFADTIARYRFNRLHLHLSDDQGWRIEIRSRPRLVEGGPFFTQAEYAELVDYAGERGVAIVPEIDMPGHVNAALVAYPELAPPGVAAEPYSGREVGFSTLDTTKAATWAFLEDVVGEVAELSPGAWLHIGGDEAAATPDAAYVEFIVRALELVRAHGKTPIGWEEIAKAPLPAGTIVQHWKDQSLARAAREQGAQLIMSPATRAYLDQKYDASSPLGLEWAGHVTLRDAWDWDPGDVLGVEAALWSETFETLADVESMAFPRLLAIAERAWRPDRGGWDDFLRRASAEADELEARGVNVARAALA